MPQYDDKRIQPNIISGSGPPVLPNDNSQNTDIIQKSIPARNPYRKDCLGVLYLAISRIGIMPAQADSEYPKGGYAETSKKTEHKVASMRRIIGVDGLFIFRSIFCISFRYHRGRGHCDLLLACRE